MSTIHASLRAIAYLRGEKLNSLALFSHACDGRVAGETFIGVRLAMQGKYLPTCPECLVLWDMALEAGTPPALPPSHGPEHGGGAADGGGGEVPEGSARPALGHDLGGRTVPSGG